ncbi:MAG: hypothetical protein J6I45_08780 [Clostridia bacterium]|nr:hypothetical protein [Clostridia bacterium]
MKRWILLIFIMLALFLTGCTGKKAVPHEYSAGFAAVEIVPPETDAPLYIAGYRNGREIEGVLDYQRASALWLEDGETSILLISIDCVALASDTVEEIRSRLDPFCRETGCDSVNVIATHTHAGIDTLGLWGPVAMEGKNSEFMKCLISAAVESAKAAYEDRSHAVLSYASTPTKGFQEDSRDPQVWDSNLYQIHIDRDSAGKCGIRVISYAAHAESLRGDNLLLSRDFPGVMSDLIAEVGEEMLFLPGAIGGLIMTPELFEGDAVVNRDLTGEQLVNCYIYTADERPIDQSIKTVRVEFELPMENTLFIYYKFLGILQNDVKRGLFGGYSIRSELTLIQLGDLTLALLPCEIFPELVFGTGNDTDPAPLEEIAEAYGIENLVIVGLANDELGYVIPPSDFVLDENLPYIAEAEGDHYEETNSTSPRAAEAIAEAFERALKKLTK